MHILKVWTKNMHQVGDLSFVFEAEPGGTRKWTLLPFNPSSLELLRLIALICGGLPWLGRLSFPFGQLVADAVGEGVVAAQLELHRPRDLTESTVKTVIAVGVSVNSMGCLTDLRTASGLIPGDVPLHRPSFGQGNRRLLFLAYGPGFDRQKGETDFDFSDPWFRLQRFRSLFEDGALLTSAVSFLTKLQYRVRKGRHPAKITFANLCAVLRHRLHIPTALWEKPGADLPKLWKGLNQEQQGLLIPVIDAVRHVMDASPHDSEPLHRPGILLFHGLDSFCSPELLPAYAAAVDELFPYMQIICTLATPGMSTFPDERRQARLPVAVVPKRATLQRSRRRFNFSKGRVLLVQVDGSMPNLALMKLATHFERTGKPFALSRSNGWKQSGVSAVYASCVFDRESSLRRVAAIKEFYGDRLQLGGSGVNLSKRLPPEIESLPAAYHLYPELEGRGLGFLTRGCPAKCAFCIVPVKEGGVRQVAQLDDLLEGGRRRELILLDDNILAFDGAEALLEEMAKTEIAVNFNQTLDILRVSPDLARLLRRVKCMNVRFSRINYYFSLNDCRALGKVREKYELFGFGKRENVQFVCMYGFDTTLADDVERFRFLRSLPSAYAFVQEYRPICNRTSRLGTEFFDDSADQLIDELIRIIFSQNMKSMEKYYRWLSNRYYEQFGTLNMPLVKTIFRYNNRERYGTYVAEHPPRSSRQA